jgi:hypothetical protein
MRVLMDSATSNAVLQRCNPQRTAVDLEPKTLKKTGAVQDQVYPTPSPALFRRCPLAALDAHTRLHNRNIPDPWIGRQSLRVVNSSLHVEHVNGVSVINHHHTTK